MLLSFILPWPPPNSMVHNNLCNFLSKYAEGSLRLSSSSATTTLTPSGRLEVYINGRWGTVCSNGFSDTSATVVCEQLGFNNVEGWTTIGSQRYVLASVISEW